MYKLKKIKSNKIKKNNNKNSKKSNNKPKLIEIDPKK
jgi:hypothetical protein